MPINVTPELNAAIADAKDVPSLLAGFEAVAPELAQRLEGEAVVASKTPIGTLVGALVGWLSSRFGLGWDQNLCAIVGGAAAIAGTYVAIWLRAHPIGTWFKKAAAAAPTAAGVLLAISAGALIAACATVATMAPIVVSAVEQVVQDGQLVCKYSGGIAAIATAAGQAVLAKDATAASVSEVCALLDGGTPVPPPASNAAPVATVTLPSSITIPLG